MSDPTPEWNPWQAVEAMGERLEVVEVDVQGRKGAWQRDALGDIIVLHPALDPIERRAVLTHELIHAERGIGWGMASAATMQREEAIVRQEVAVRLVPPRRLAELVRSQEGVGPVDLDLIADTFEVPLEVARLAVAALAGAPPGRRSRGSTGLG